MMNKHNLTVYFLHEMVHVKVQEVRGPFSYQLLLHQVLKLLSVEIQAFLCKF